jgi:putative ABC transport system ATP-binding protein
MANSNLNFVQFQSSSSTSPVLVVKDLVKTYQMGTLQVNALNGVNMEVYPGEFIAIMGASGSGKTTLLNVIGGLDAVTSGSIEIEGKNIARMNDHDLTKIRRSRMGFIFQSYNLMPVLNAAENVELPLKINNVSRKERNDRVKKVMDMVGLTDRMHNKPNQLSGGQQQRVSIARALAIDPAIILADEPTGALDSNTGNSIIQLLQSLNVNMGKTIIMVTHDRKIAQHTQKIFHMSDGKIVQIEQVTP